MCLFNKNGKCRQMEYGSTVDLKDTPNKDGLHQNFHENCQADYRKQLDCLSHSNDPTHHKTYHRILWQHGTLTELRQPDLPCLYHAIVHEIRSCAVVMGTKLPSRNRYEATNRIWRNDHLRHTTLENMTTMGMVDTYDSVITEWSTNILSRPHKPEWASGTVQWTHKTS